MVWYLSIGDQYKWLERDLANVDRSKTPWLVAAWHPPWFSSYKAHYREVECMRVAMEELLYSHGVDIVFKFATKGQVETTLEVQLGCTMQLGNLPIRLMLPWKVKIVVYLAGTRS